MAGLELIVLLGVAVLTGEVAARRFRLPAPLVLLAIGSGLSFVPRLHNAVLPPDVVLFVFIPGLVYWEAVNNISLREIRDNLRIIALTAVGLDLVTALCVAAIASALGLPRPLALVLGAIVAHTDARAMAEVLAKTQRRISAILRAEGLISDGTSLVLYSIAVRAAIANGHVSPALVSAEFAESAVASVAIGLAVGSLAQWVRHYVTEDRLVGALSLLTPFFAFLPAELAHVSGVVAVATCGIISGLGGDRLLTAAARRQATGFWRVTTFAFSDALFVLTGLDLHRIVAELHSDSWPKLVLGLSGIVIATVIGLRLLWFFTVPYLLRAIDRRAAQRALRIPARHRLFTAWAGMRGSVSLALALALPLTTSAGPLRRRETTIAVTFTVILFTIVVQGLSLPAVLRWARLTPDPTQAYEEALANRTALQRSLAILPALAAELGVPDTVRDRIAAEYRARADELTSTMDDTTLTVTSTGTAAADWDRLLRRALIPAERDAALNLRRVKRIDNTVFRRLQARLDTEEIRLSDNIDKDT